MFQRAFLVGSGLCGLLTAGSLAISCNLEPNDEYFQALEDLRISEQSCGTAEECENIRQRISELEGSKYVQTIAKNYKDCRTEFQNISLTTGSLGILLLLAGYRRQKS